MTTHVMQRDMTASTPLTGDASDSERTNGRASTTTIGRTYRFEAAHRLPLLPATHKCHHMHGHNYRIEITVCGPLDDRGFVMDFAEIDADVMPLIARVDHKVLNDVEGLENPTAEVIAAWFLERIPNCESVRVYENDDCWAEVRR